MPDLQVTEHTSGNIVVLELAGRLDGSATEAMEHLHAAFETASNAVLVDFGQVDYINSTGIALVVGLAAKARATGLPLLVCGLSDHYAHVFRITRIAEFVEMHPDRVGALAAATDQPQPTS